LKIEAAMRPVVLLVWNNEAVMFPHEAGVFPRKGAQISVMNSLNIPRGVYRIVEEYWEIHDSTTSIVKLILETIQGRTP
jgi:hypothetical protein